MLNRGVFTDRSDRRRRAVAVSVPGILLFLFLTIGSAPRAEAQGTTALPPISIGGGVRTNFTHTSPDDLDDTDTFGLDDVRLYVNGAVTPKVKFMFNTAYTGADNDVNVLDAVARFELSDKVNFWAGRFLPPSDRANLYGPFYANHWNVYTDGVQDGYPFIYQGRDNGFAYWGQFGIAKLSGGIFDGSSATHGGSTTVLTAGRAQFDFWDPEGGYYLNGTYYGAKNLLAVAIAGQVQGEDRSAWNADFLLEKKVGNGGAFTIEAEWADYSGLGGYSGDYAEDKGGYFLGAYLFPMMENGHKFQILGKFAVANFSEGVTIINPDYEQKTTELNFNYLFKEFDGRVMVFYKDTRYDGVLTNVKQFGVGLQIQK